MYSDLPAECDVVVIGAGIGGLTGAALLAKAGLHVCVVEAEQRPGGYLAGFQRGAFRFDTAIHWLNECGPDGSVRRAFELLAPDAPATPPQRRIRRYKGDSFDYLLTSEPDLLRDAWMREFPADAAGIRAFFAAAKSVGTLLQKLSAGRAFETMGLGERLATAVRLAPSGLRLLRHAARSAEVGLAKHFRHSPKLRRVFCSEDSLISCLAPVGWAYCGDFQLPPSGGSQAIPRWLCGLLDQWGGTLALGCRVTAVLVEGNSAAGVRLVAGRGTAAEYTIRARHVVAACDVTTLFERLLPREVVRREVEARVREADIYPSSVTVSLGLDISPRELGFDEELIFLTRDDVARAEHNSGDPHKTGISILAPSLRDPSLAPAGRGTLTVCVPARLDYGDHWATGPCLERGQEYRTFKQAYADVLLERVEAAVAPGLRRHILVCDVATPVTHLRYTGNRDGSIMGQTPSGKNIRGRVARYRTPIQNLFVGGHWAECGGGVPIAVRAGLNSALLVLQRERPAAFKAIRDVVDSRGPVPELDPAGWVDG